MKTPTELRLFNENQLLRKKLAEAERLAFNRNLVCEGAMLVFEAIRKTVSYKDRGVLDKLIEVYKNSC